MSDNQKIFEMLSESEKNAFYAYTHCTDAELKKMLKDNLQSAKNALVTFARATGCHN